jgi:hypothetical protein
MERFEATWVQTDDQCYIAYGPKGAMGQLARLLNRDDVTVKLASFGSEGRWA